MLIAAIRTPTAGGGADSFHRSRDQISKPEQPNQKSTLLHPTARRQVRFVVQLDSKQKLEVRI